MKKLAIVIDSFSGYTEKEIKDFHPDMYFLPLQISYNNHTFLEGIDDCTPIKNAIIYGKNEDIKTSLPPVYLIQELINKLSKEYENVIFLNLNSHLSSTHDTVTNYAQSKKNVFVIDNHFVGNQYLEVPQKCFELAKQNQSIEVILSTIENIKKTTLGFIIPSSFASFVKSGRLQGIKKFLTSKFSVLIKVYEGAIKISGISKTFKGGVKKALAKFEKFIEEKGFLVSDFNFWIVYAFDNEITENIKKIFSEYNIKVDRVQLSSVSTAIHTGYKAVYMGIEKKLK